MQRIEKIKSILKSNNIVFSEVETGIFKLEGEDMMLVYYK